MRPREQEWDGGSSAGLGDRSGCVSRGLCSMRGMGPGPSSTMASRAGCCFAPAPITCSWERCLWHLPGPGNFLPGSHAQPLGSTGGQTPLHQCWSRLLCHKAPTFVPGAGTTAAGWRPCAALQCPPQLPPMATGIAAWVPRDPLPGTPTVPKSHPAVNKPHSRACGCSDANAPRHRPQGKRQVGATSSTSKGLPGCHIHGGAGGKGWRNSPKGRWQLRWPWGRPPLALG